MIAAVLDRSADARTHMTAVAAIAGHSESNPSRRPPARRPHLVCRWHRTDDDRLACSWRQLGANERAVPDLRRHVSRRSHPTPGTSPTTTPNPAHTKDMKMTAHISKTQPDPAFPGSWERPVRAASAGAESGSPWRKLCVRLVRAWRERSRSRRLLSTLDHRALRDIGLSPADAAREAAKPFWLA